MKTINELMREDARRTSDIDTLVVLTDGQMELVGQMEELFLKMQEAHIAFAMNEDGAVVVYNAEHITDCEGTEPFGEIPDGYEAVEVNDMHAMFPVWTGETLCLKRGDS